LSKKAIFEKKILKYNFLITTLLPGRYLAFGLVMAGSSFSGLAASLAVSFLSEFFQRPSQTLLDRRWS
jgi:hypothetical protein